MKKIIMILMISGITAGLFGNTVGVFGNFDGSAGGGSITGSFDKIEAELGISQLFDGTLSLKGDYQVYSDGISGDLSWNVSVGAGLYINSDVFGVSALAPVELVYDIPQILNGMDIYLQGRPGIDILPDVDFAWDLGLGIRFQL